MGLSEILAALIRTARRVREDRGGGDQEADDKRRDEEDEEEDLDLEDEEGW
jgi:hypothetical protein